MLTIPFTDVGKSERDRQTDRQTDIQRDVCNLGRRIAGSRDERPHVGRQRETHNVTSVAIKGRCLLTGLNVPQSAVHTYICQHSGENEH